MEKTDYKHSYKYLHDEVLRHISNFIGAHFFNLCYTKVVDLKTEYFLSKEPIPFEEIHSLEYKEIKEGEVWSTVNFECAWFHLTGKIDKVEDIDKLYIKFSNSGEGLLVDKNGSAIKGFTSGSLIFGTYDRPIEKDYAPLKGFVDEDGNIDVYIDGASNNIIGGFPERKATFRTAGIYRRNDDIFDLYHDVDVLFEYVNSISDTNPLKEEIALELKKVINLFIYEDKDACRKGKEITSKLLKIKGEENNTKVTAVGHAHLDLAWLWPIRESKRKAKRTFANTLFLMDKYDGYTFVVSQPQQLEWMKELDPTLYAKLKERVKEGRLEPVGGGWVENDTNLPSEESLVRQELYGQKFWKEEFGSYVRLRWLPDTFGYSGALPQILKQSNQDYFMTIKISWSNRTIFPYHTFKWQGIDGSELLVHMPPEGTYNSYASPLALNRAIYNMTEYDPKDKFLMVYGIGDGGGGPSMTMVERCKREENISFVPKVKMGNAHEFFDSIDKDPLPTFKGEMYLERHRATYTSQSNNKNFNREMEGRLVAIETVSSALGKDLSKEEIDKIWKEVLFFQFHDILPGSSIIEVYTETDREYLRMIGEMERIANGLNLSFIPSLDKPLINYLGGEVNRGYKVDDKYVVYKGEDNLINGKTLSVISESGSIDEIQNDYFVIKLDERGFISSITFKESGKVALLSANRLRVFKDFGDAWDFLDDYRDQGEVYMTLDKTTVRDYGDLVEVDQYFSYKESKLHQRMVIYKEKDVIEIYHDVDWKNLESMLRAEFKPAVYSDVVRSDIQFGYLGRPTTDETDHDAAQFEMCCSKWFDISNEEQGLSILNNAKSGFYAKNGEISLDLLRSTNYPCINAEHKHISYSYAIYPHLGGFDAVKIDDKANDFNGRYLFGEANILLPNTDNCNVIVSAFKKAYDGDGYILRLFERSGEAQDVELFLPKDFELVEEVNLLEDSLGPVSDFTFKPFEIRTFRLRKK